jgi:uncharacterized membrane protein YqaE (UPF0057 family)
MDTYAEVIWKMTSIFLMLICVGLMVLTLFLPTLGTWKRRKIFMPIIINLALACSFCCFYQFFYTDWGKVSDLINGILWAFSFSCFIFTFHNMKQIQANRRRLGIE